MLPPDFKGKAARLQPNDIEDVSAEYGVAPRLVRAVQHVESKATGFLPSGRAVILFEAKYFHTLTGGKFDASHPSISCPVWNKALYKGGEAEYARLSEAYALAPDAALRSASWGLGQVMGDNAKACGYASAEAFVLAAMDSEKAQLHQMLAFCASKGLIAKLKAQDWRGFAAGYNGTGQIDLYSGRLKAAYDALPASPPPAPAPVQVPLAAPVPARVDIHDGVFGAIGRWFTA